MAIIGLIGLLCLWSTPCMARLLEEDNIYSQTTTTMMAVVDMNGGNDLNVAHHLGDVFEEKENGSKSFGYVEADSLWTNGYAGSSYHCDDCYGQFWGDVKKIVFETCEQKWDPHGFWAQEQLECKYGAEEFTMQQIGKCFGTTDNCYQLGIGAAASVAGSFCKQNGLFQQREWLPRECKEHSITTCECDAVNLVEKFIQGNVCDVYTDCRALDYVDEIYNACVQEVNEMEQEAKLQW